MSWKYKNRQRNGEAEAKALEDLLVFGYSCHLFVDGERHAEHNASEHLISHPSASNLQDMNNGDNDNGGSSGAGPQQLRIDRYDCRLHLHDVIPYDADVIANELAELNQVDELWWMDEGERVEEEMCNDERYADLIAAEHKEKEEEERKRTEGAAIAYNYENKNQPKEEDEEEEEEEDLTPYTPIPELKVPKGVNLPETEHRSHIIHRTAQFVANQGAQMEIVIKARQKNSTKFGFLDWDHPHHYYYKHTLKMIKENKYKPQLPEIKPKVKKEPKKPPTPPPSDSDNSGSDSDSDGGYLHPSLFAPKRTIAITASTNSSHLSTSASMPVIRDPTYKLGEGDDVYSSLFKNISALQPKPVEPAKPLTAKEKISQLGLLAVSYEAETSNADSDTKVESVSTDQASYYDIESSGSFSQSILSRGPPPTEYVDWHKWFYDTDAPSEVQPTAVPPPPDVAPLVSKAAEFVAKYGVPAEQRLKQQPELQLTFLDSDDEYFGFYQLRLRWLQYDHYHREHRAAQHQYQAWQQWANDQAAAAAAVSAAVYGSAAATADTASATTTTPVVPVNTAVPPPLVGTAAPVAVPIVVNTAAPPPSLVAGQPPPVVYTTPPPIAVPIHLPPPNLPPPAVPGIPMGPTGSHPNAVVSESSGQPSSANGDGSLPANSQIAKFTIKERVEDKPMGVSAVADQEEGEIGDDENKDEAADPETEERLRLDRKRKAQMFMETIMKKKREKRLAEMKPPSRLGDPPDPSFIGPMPPPGVVVPCTLGAASASAPNLSSLASPSDKDRTSSPSSHKENRSRRDRDSTSKRDRDRSDRDRDREQSRSPTTNSPSSRKRKRRERRSSRSRSRSPAAAGRRERSRSRSRDRSSKKRSSRRRRRSRSRS